MVIEKVQTNWPLIEVLIGHFGEANVSLAGGCIRDTLYNKPVKDVDVYIFHDGGEEYSKLVSSRVFSKKGDSGYDESEIEVYTHEHFHDMDIILINKRYWNNIQAYVDQCFDSSICKVWFNFRNGLGYTEDFKKGEAEKTVYWYETVHAVPTDFRDTAHYTRIQKKYVDWKHVYVKDNTLSV